MSFENEQEWFDLFNSDRRAMVLGDLDADRDRWCAQTGAWFGGLKVGVNCPTPGCFGAENHCPPCGPDMKPRVERIKIHEGAGAYERAYTDAMTTGKGFARMPFSGDFKAIYGSAAADTLTQEAQSNGEYALGPDPVDYHYTAKFGWQPKQKFWSCKHFLSVIDNWGKGRKPEYCLVCHPVPDTFVCVDSENDRYTCARCGAQYSQHLTQVDAQDAARAGGEELGIINGEDRCERCPVEATKEPRTFVSAGDPSSVYLCKCGAWYHRHKTISSGGFVRDDGTAPFAACP